jgi:hypothetical protein
MKRLLFIGLFVFSLALNLAVAATLGWHLWKDYRHQVFSGSAGPDVSHNDLKQIRAVWMKAGPERMMETRRKIMDKQLQLLDEIAKNPGKPEVADQTLNELTALKAQMEKQAITRISNTLAALPHDKREQFLTFLKTRACMGPGMGMRRHGGMRLCPARGPLGAQ